MAIWHDPAIAAGPRIAVVSRGVANDPLSVHQKQAAPLVEALGRMLPVAGFINLEPGRAERALAAATSFVADREEWRRRFRFSPLMHRTLSARARRAVASLDPPPDVVLQVNGMLQAATRDYVVWTDATAPSTARMPGRVLPAGRRRERWFALERELYRGARHCFATSRLAADSIVSDFGVPSGRVTVTGLGSNFPVRATPPDRDPRRVLFVGADAERKGLPDLLHAFSAVRRRIPDATLTVAGATVPDAGAGVRSLGVVRDRERLGAEYAHAGVFCLPSYFEGTPLAVLEAMANGLACVVTDVGGMPEMVLDGETGLVVPAGDPDALARALSALLSDPAEVVRMGDAGRVLLERSMTWDAVAGRIRDVLVELP